MADAKPPPDEADELLMPSQVVRRFRVDPETVTRWARAGKRTPSRPVVATAASEIQRCLDDGTGEEQAE